MLSNTATELSAILPPRHHNLRGIAASAHVLSESQTTGEDRHILSREVADGTIILDDYSAVDELTQLKSSFARR